MTTALCTPRARSYKRPLRSVMRSKTSKSPQYEVSDQIDRPNAPRILCIDDDPEICRTLELRLGRYQADVAIAYYGTQGFWEAITDRPNLILMDVGMPSGDGHFVLESLRNNRSTERIPVIVLTGMRSPDIKHQMMSMGADCFLNKPIHFDVLLNEMRKHVDISERQTQ